MFYLRFWLGMAIKTMVLYSPMTKKLFVFQATPVVLDIIQAVAVCRKYKSYLSYKSNGKNSVLEHCFYRKNLPIELHLVIHG